MIRCGSSRRRSTGYSTFGWVLVSAAVEAAANEPFFTFMRTQVFKPLGMADTTSDSATEPIPNRVTFYYRDSLETPVRARAGDHVDYSCFAGAGAFLSTPSDLVRFGMAINGGKLLQPATVSMLQTPQQLDVGRGDRLRPRLDTVFALIIVAVIGVLAYNYWSGHGLTLFPSGSSRCGC